MIRNEIKHDISHDISLKIVRMKSKVILKVKKEGGSSSSSSTTYIGDTGKRRSSAF